MPLVSIGEVDTKVPTPAERKALLFFGAVIVLGGATRLYRSITNHAPYDARSSAALKLQIEAVDSASAAKNSGRKPGKRSRSRKGAPPNPPPTPAVIDLDVASADEIETLRGVGPALAGRIVADRDSLGAFGSIGGLERVRGVGPALAGKLAPHVTFSGVPRPVNTAGSRHSVMKKPKRKASRRNKVY